MTSGVTAIWVWLPAWMSRPTVPLNSAVREVFARARQSASLTSFGTLTKRVSRRSDDGAADAMEAVASTTRAMRRVMEAPCARIDRAAREISQTICELREIARRCYRDPVRLVALAMLAACGGSH